MLQPLTLPPGVYRNGTELQSKGRYDLSDKVRWFEGAMMPIGGWRKRIASQSALRGKCRAIWPWKDNTQSRWIALGTSSHLYAMNAAGTISDITPLRKTTNPLANNPITTTNGSATITVADTAHGGAAGDTVTLSGATATGGLTIGQLNAPLVIVTASANSWTAVVAGTAATSSASGGGAAVVAKYQIHPGMDDSTAKTAFGAGPFGAYAFGTPRPDTGSSAPATTWSPDNFGQNLVAMNDFDGSLYQWSLVTTSPAALLTNAPTGQGCLIVTAERFLMCAKNRTVSWSDQEDNNTWTPTATNQAGSIDLATSGSVQQMLRIKAAVLVLTDSDAWTGTYQDPTYVYGFERVGDGCGAISRHAGVATQSQAAWMGVDGFYGFDGYVQPIPCDVADYVFGNINQAQRSKIVAEYRSAYGEVWWHYPSTGSSENDSYVVWNHRENHWAIGTKGRTAVCDKGVFANPLSVTPSGYVYDEEVGTAMDGQLPFAETGPIRIGNGDNMALVSHIIPDEVTLGGVTLTLKAKTYPNSAETVYGPMSATDPTDILFQAAQIKVRYDGVALQDWRVGEFRIDVSVGDAVFA